MANQHEVFDMFKDVRDFHLKFTLPVEPYPSFPPKELLEFRVKFLEEEVNEFKDACNANDLTLALDALIDLVYIALGTAVTMRLPWYECWNHVQNANMKKIRASVENPSIRNQQFDVVKPAGWESPNNKIRECIDYWRVRNGAQPLSMERNNNGE